MATAATKMSPLKYSENIKLVRAIKNELKSSTVGKLQGEKFSNDASIKHMLEVMRQNQVTEKRFCRPQNHYKYFAQTYLTYLSSLRTATQLIEKYFHKGEKSVKDSARLVGLELPKQNKH